MDFQKVKCTENLLFNNFISSDMLFANHMNELDITKPVDPDKLLFKINKDKYNESKVKNPDAFSHIITNNKKIFKIFRFIELIADDTSPVLITGETGVGKELFAQAIHISSQCKGSLIPINIAGLDDQMFTDTLFGHKKGAYTNAITDRDGLIKKAENGTLFLDEIGDLSIQSQMKLLRLIDNHEYYPLGSDCLETSNTRVIAATNKNLTQKCNNNTFMPDLFFRLCLYHIKIPALRERLNDIPLLINYFVDKYANDFGKNRPYIPDEVYTLFTTYRIPGNIRVLEGILKLAVKCTTSSVLPIEVIKSKLNSLGGGYTKVINNNVKVTFPGEELPKKNEIVGLLYEEALKRTQGNQMKAAFLVGVSGAAISNYKKKNTAKNN